MAQETKKAMCRSPCDSMLTVGDVAHFLNIHVNTMRRWSDIGVLRSYRIGPRDDRGFRREDILALIPLENRGKHKEHR